MKLFYPLVVITAEGVVACSWTGISVFWDVGLSLSLMVVGQMYFVKDLLSPVWMACIYVATHRGDSSNNIGDQLHLTLSS